VLKTEIAREKKNRKRKLKDFQRNTFNWHGSWFISSCVPWWLDRLTKK